MSVGYIVRIDAWDPATDSAVVLRAASHDVETLCQLDGATWWPALLTLPVLGYDFFDGAFGTDIATPAASLELATDPFAGFAALQLADARIRLWSGEIGQAFSGFTLRVDGRIEAQPAIDAGVASVDFRVDDRWLDGPLLVPYAGSGGIEGPAELKGTVKPLLLGAPRFAGGVLIDAVDNVFQLSAYGAINDVELAFERLGRFGAVTGDYASLAALKAATIAHGGWGTCKALGLVRHGAPPEGQLSWHVRGDAAGTDGWARKPGQLIRRVAIIGGGTGKISDTSLNALDVARPWNISLALTEQTTAREVIKRIAASVNAVAGVSWTGKLFAAPIGIGTPTVTLAADGTALPPVSDVQQLANAAPWWRLAIEAERTVTVHSIDEVAFAARPVEMGIYDSTETYREGMVVSLPDGSRFMWIALAPGVNIAPPNVTYWAPMNDGPTRNVARGAWAGATAYVVGDIVEHDGSSYTAVAAHTSAGGTPPPNVNWQLLAAAGTDGLDGVSINSSHIVMYRRTATNSAPAKPDNNIDVSLVDSSTSGSLDGWSLIEPSVIDGAYLWSIVQYFSTTTTVATLTPAGWGAQFLERVDDYRAVMDPFATTLPAEASGAVVSAYLPIEGQLTFGTASKVLLHTSVSEAGLTVAEVSESGLTGTINTAANTPIAGKPKGFWRITAVDPSPTVLKAIYTAKVIKDGVDYLAKIEITKAIEGADGRSALLTPSTDRIKLNTAGQLWPPSQTITIGLDPVGYTTTDFDWTMQLQGGAYLTPVTSYLSGDGTATVTLNIPAILAAAGDAAYIVVNGYADSILAPPVIIWLDREMAVPGNEWPDPQFASGDSNWGAAATSPFFLQTDGAAGNYQFKNYLQIYQVGVAADRLIKVAEGIPVNHAGETIYFGFVGGKISGSTHYSAGIYMKFYDVDGVQVGSTVTLVNQTVFDPTGNWPHYYGEAVTPAGAATREIGFISDHLGGGTSNMNYVIASPYSQRYELNANNTEQRTAAHRTPPLTQEVPAGVVSGIKSYPTALNFYRDQGATDVTASSTWAAYPSAGISCSISVVGSVAVLSITAMSQPGTIDVVSTRNNLNVRSRLTFVPNYDAEPQIGGSVSADSPSIAAVTSTSYVTAIGPIRVDTKSIGRIDFTGQLVIAPAFTGTGGADMRPRYRTPIGSGTWVEIGMIVNAGDVTFSADNPTKARSGATLQVSGLLTNTAYEVDFRIKKSATSTAAAVVLHAGTRGVAQGL